MSLLDGDEAEPSKRTASGASTEIPTCASVRDWGAATSIGLVRAANEDAWGVQGTVFVVADGMGGHPGGELAADETVRNFLDGVEGAITDRQYWTERVQTINEKVRAVGDQQGMTGLGSTLVAAVVADSTVTVINVGDSRAYRLRGDNLRELTRDQSVYVELIDAGLDIEPYRKRGYPLAGLTSYIGASQDVLRVDVAAITIQGGDRLLLCSDGVHSQITSTILAEALTLATCQDAAERLVRSADHVGGRDNATAVVIDLGPESSFDEESMS